MFYSIELSLVALILVASTAMADTLSLEAFLSRVQTKHPFFRKEALTTDIETEQQLSYRGAEDWRFQTTPSFSHFEPTNKSLGVPRKEESTGIETSVARNIWRTGGRLSLGHRYGFTDQEIDDLVVPTPTGELTIPVGPSRFHENGLTLSYSQPLLRNAGGVLDRLDYTLQGYTVKIDTLVSQENQEAFLKSVAQRYLDWVLLAEQRRISNQRLWLANRELGQVQRKFEVGLVDRVDVYRAKDSVLSTKAVLSRIQASLSAIRTALATLATDPDLPRKRPDFNPYKILNLPPEKEVVDRLKTRARVLHALRLQAEQQRVLLDGLQNAASPQLDINLSVGVKSGDESFGDATSFDKTDSQIALGFSYPLGNRTAQAKVRRTRLQRQQTLEDLRNETVQLESTMRNVLEQIHGLAATLDLNKQRIKTAKTKSREEEKRYELGKTELTFVIQSRDSEALAQLAYAENAVDYQKQLIEYKALLDILLPSPKAASGGE